VFAPGTETCINAQRAHPLPKLALLQMATYGTYCLLGSKLFLHASPAARGSVLDSRELILVSTEVMSKKSWYLALQIGKSEKS
jgi:hypothetical protein